MTTSSKIAVLYAGPTLATADRADLSDLIVVPPIKRGDLAALIRQRRPPGVVVIADGYFHLANLSVGHAEIRAALAVGWEVWGVSSMGAIRGAEMENLGMRGFGRVFERFRDDPDFRDDEVALLHEPGPPYRAVSEPLVHIREALEDLGRRGVLTKDAIAEIVDRQMALWFGDRTLGLLGREISAWVPTSWSVDDWLAGFDQYRIKTRDLEALLAERPWRA